MEICFAEDVRASEMELTIGVWEISIFRMIAPTYDFSDPIREIAIHLQQTYTLDTIKDHAIIGAYRKFYWKYLDIDPTKTRPACEALLRRILANKPLPIISAFVDAYNWASVESTVAMSGYDASILSGPLMIRFPRTEESFTPIASEPKKLPPKALVVADALDRIMCQFPYRDAQFSMVLPGSTKLILLVYGVNGIPINALRHAFDLTKKHLDWMATQHILEYHGESVHFYSNK